MSSNRPSKTNGQTQTHTPTRPWIIGIVMNILVAVCFTKVIPSTAEAFVPQSKIGVHSKIEDVTRSLLFTPQPQPQPQPHGCKYTFIPKVRIPMTTLREGGSNENNKSSENSDSGGGGDNGNNGDNGNDSFSKLLERFISPIIDDPAMPLTEAGLVQIVAPTLQLFWIVSIDSPYPSWAMPLYDYTFSARGAFLAPTLIHGAGLACCWLLGCLSAQAYEKSNFRVQEQEGERTKEYGKIVTTTLKAGAFATGILILATQLDLYQEFGGYVQAGESQETDLRLYRAAVELINDIFFQCIVLIPWRLFRSNFD